MHLGACWIMIALFTAFLLKVLTLLMPTGIDPRIDDRTDNAGGIFDNKFHRRKARQLAVGFACLASSARGQPECQSCCSRTCCHS